jgi:hypothetical protein
MRGSNGCYGDVRHVGDSVTMTVFNDDGQLIERRHDYQNELRGQPITRHTLPSGARRSLDASLSAAMSSMVMDPR